MTIFPKKRAGVALAVLIATSSLPANADPSTCNVVMVTGGVFLALFYLVPSIGVAAGSGTRARESIWVPVAGPIMFAAANGGEGRTLGMGAVSLLQAASLGAIGVGAVCAIAEGNRAPAPPASKAAGGFRVIPYAGAQGAGVAATWSF